MKDSNNRVLYNNVTLNSRRILTDENICLDAEVVEREREIEGNSSFKTMVKPDCRDLSVIKVSKSFKFWLFSVCCDHGVFKIYSVLRFKYFEMCPLIQVYLC